MTQSDCHVLIAAGSQVDDKTGRWWHCKIRASFLGGSLAELHFVLHKLSGSQPLIWYQLAGQRQSCVSFMPAPPHPVIAYSYQLWLHVGCCCFSISTREGSATKPAEPPPPPHLARDECRAKSSTSGFFKNGFWWQDFAGLPSRPLSLLLSPSSSLGEVGNWIFIGVQIDGWRPYMSCPGGTLQTVWPPTALHL